MNEKKRQKIWNTLFIHTVLHFSYVRAMEQKGKTFSNLTLFWLSEENFFCLLQQVQEKNSREKSEISFTIIIY